TSAPPPPLHAALPILGTVFDALGDGTRRRILEVLAGGEQPAGVVADTLQAGQPISQPAVSQHLKVLLEAGLVAVRAEGNRRYYRSEEHTSELQSRENL